NSHRQEILDGLHTVKKVAHDELIQGGFAAAQLTIQLMRDTFQHLPPPKIVQAYIQSTGSHAERANTLWKAFGKQTIGAMKDGTHVLAVLWESAWAEGGGEDHPELTHALSESDAMDICGDASFLESFPIEAIGTHLKEGALPA